MMCGARTADRHALRYVTSARSFLGIQFDLFMADTELTPRPGILLIAPPMLEDPNFRRTVVLLCEHDAEGSFGLILNRPLDLQLSDVMEDIVVYNDTISLGGPVHRNTLHFLHRYEEALPDAITLPNGVQWGGDFDLLRSLMESGDIATDDLRFFVGYAGWSPGQLEDEIEAGGWILAEGSDDAVFAEDPSTLWRTVLRQMGGEYAVLANFPDDPRMN